MQGIHLLVFVLVLPAFCVFGEGVCSAGEGSCRSRTPLIAGNWKMNTDLTSAVALTKDIAEKTKDIASGAVDVALFPPYVFLRDIIQSLEGSNPNGISVGAQNVYFEPKGAFTGAVSASMLQSVGVSMVLVGHSERRSVFKESDAEINRSLKQVLAHGMTPVLCVGETLEENEAGLNEEVIGAQLTKGLQGLTAQDAALIVVAYEPVWAIGTGKVATPEVAQTVHRFIRTWLSTHFGEGVAQQVRILYGGSVTPESAGALLAQPDVDGALVGGASLKADSFVAIVRAALTA